LKDHANSARQSWIGGLSERAGPLIEPALRFLQRYRSPTLGEFGGGVEGVRWLARELVTFAYLETVSDRDEHDFVEGAGALLGLILIDHLADARHAARNGTHRIRIGAYAFFDPFGAVEQALDAEDVHKSLAASLACAERDGRGVGAMSRVVRTLSDLLRIERPRLRIARQFDAQLTLVDSDRDGDDESEIDLDLTQAIRATASQGMEAIHEVARRMISLLPGAPEPELALGELRARIVPRICRTDLMTSLSAQGCTELFQVAFVGELSIAVLIEHEGRARYLRTREATALAMPSAALLEHALDNLLARSARFRLSDMSHDAKGCLITRTGDGRDSTRVLLPSVRRLLRERLGEEVVVGIPHRDAFLCCDARDPATLTLMKERVSSDAARAPHRLSDELFRCTTEGLTPHVR
jgi:uncharacterized protein YtpQ (UPF0354 family)